jgi:hypothetical protein
VSVFSLVIVRVVEPSFNREPESVPLSYRTTPDGPVEVRTRYVPLGIWTLPPGTVEVEIDGNAVMSTAPFDVDISVSNDDDTGMLVLDTIPVIDT